MTAMPAIRRAISEMENQRIGKVARVALGEPDVIALWFANVEARLSTAMDRLDAAIATRG